MAGEDTMREALNNGQSDFDLDDGHTPTDEESNEDEAGGHTPDSSPTDDGGSTPEASSDEDVDEQTNIEDEAEEQLESETEVDEPTDDHDQDSESGGEEEEEDVDEEEEEDDWYYQGEHSQYRTEEEYRRAVDKKDDLIHRYRQELEQERQERQEAIAQANSLREAMPEDQQKEMVIRKYMREELGEEADDVMQASEEELATNQDLQKKRTKARARAEAKYEQQLEEAEQKQKQQVQQRKERLDEASNFVTDWVTEDRFDAHSSEERIRLQEYFEEVPESEEFNRAEKAVLLYSDHGKDAAQHYLEGLRQSFLDEQSKAVEETVEKSDPDPKPQAQPSSDGPDQPSRETEEQYQPDNPLQAIRDGL